VVVVTGAGRGIGRGEALEFARHGAKIVVNDLGSNVDGTEATSTVAEAVTQEIRDLGGEAVASGDDIADWDGARHVVTRAIDTFGRLDVLVNNAGILRDRMLFNMSEEEWDAVVRVHLKGTFCMMRWALEHWRQRAKAGETNEARIINTSSGSGLYGNPGQGNYGAAKAGIAALTIIAAREVERYGVTVNAIAPGARTRMTENLRPGRPAPSPADFDARSPDNIAPLVVWLGSAQSRGVTGRVFNVSGGVIGMAEGWRRGPARDKAARWTPGELGEVITGLLAQTGEPASVVEAQA
jgi:NAD(P)-dependent dehydrogenase (short-subunit alcohol dehydrogenase family)